MRAHLEEAANAEGEDAALRRFGTPAACARAIVRQARGYDGRSAASLAWVPGLFLALAFLAEWIWSIFMPVRGTYAAGTWSPIEKAEAVFRFGLWIPFLSKLLFTARCLRTRRWLFLPATAWGVGGMALVGAAFWALIPMNRVPSDAAKRIVSYHHQLATPSLDEREVSFWRQGQPPSWTIPVAEHMPTFVTVPGLPILLTRDVTTYNVRLFHGSKDAARRAWDANGEGWAQTVAARRQALREELAALEAGRRYPTQMFWAGYFRQVTLMLAVLFAFNALALLIGKIADTAPPRRRTASR